MKLPARSSATYWITRTGCTAPAVHEALGVPLPDIWGIGEAAHGMLAAIARHPDRPVRDLMDEAAVELMQAAPPFDGQNKPAVAPQHVGEAAGLVLRWVDKHGRPGGLPEVGFAVDRDLRPVPYYTPRCEGCGEFVDPGDVDSVRGHAGVEYAGEADAPEPGPCHCGPVDLHYINEEAAWVAVLDLHEIIRGYDDDMEREAVVARITDSKTAWHDDSPDTLQMHGQGVVLVAHVEALDRLELAKANLRSRFLNVEPFEGERLERKLDEWRDEIRWWIEAWEKIPLDVEQAARPGGGCAFCPYVLACEPAQRHLRGSGIPDTPEARATRYAVLEGSKAKLWPHLKGDTANGQEVPVQGGKLTTLGNKSKKVLPLAADVIIVEWQEAGGDPADLLRMIGLGVANLKALAKAVPAEEKKRWKAILADLIEEGEKPRLRIVRDPEMSDEELRRLLEESLIREVLAASPEAKEKPL